MIDSNILPIYVFDRVEALINKFDLPTSVPYERDLVFKALISDKKRENKLIHFILLERIGKGRIQPLSFDELYAHL